MINILFFAQTRELIGVERLSLPLVQPILLDSLREQLCQKGPKWALALEQGRVIQSVNHQIVSGETWVKAGDEVAFFPPVTGG